MVLSDNIVAYYNFDEASGDLLDQVGSADGTNSGAVLGATGIINDAWTFDGGTDVVTGTYFADNNEWTINIWVKATATPDTNGTFFFMGDGSTQKITIRRSAATNFASVEVIPSGGSVDAVGDTINIIDGGWHMITATYISETDGLALWIDGNKEDTDTPSGTFSNTDSSQFGQHTGRTDRSWKGEIDEAGIWTRVLTDAEIAELYNSGSALAFPFPSDKTVSPAALTLSTTQQGPTIIINVLPVSLSSSLGLPVPTIDTERLSSTIEVGTGTKSTRYVTTEWPIESGLQAGTQRQHGRQIALVPEVSHVSRNDRIGVNI